MIKPLRNPKSSQDYAKACAVPTQLTSQNDYRTWRVFIFHFLTRLDVFLLFGFSVLRAQPAEAMLEPKVRERPPE